MYLKHFSPCFSPASHGDKQEIRIRKLLVKISPITLPQFVSVEI